MISRFEPTQHHIQIHLQTVCVRHVLRRQGPVAHLNFHGEHEFRESREAREGEGGGGRGGVREDHVKHKTHDMLDTGAVAGSSEGGVD